MRLAAAAAAGSGVLVGAAIVATRFVIAQTDPASLALWRYTIGFCCLLVPALLGARVHFERRDLVPIALLGIGQFALLILCLNFALEYIPSALAAIIFATTPMLTLLLGALLRTERLSLFKTAGVLASIAGVALALGEKALAHGVPGALWAGALGAFASALCGATCSVFYRPYLHKYPALALGAFAMLASLVFLVPVAGIHGMHALAFTREGWIAVAFLGFASGAGYFLWLWALTHTSATRVTVFLGLGPITAALLGALTGELPTPATFFGAACVALGLWLTNVTE